MRPCLVLIALLVVTTAGCGSDDDDQPEFTPAPSASASTSVPTTAAVTRKNTTSAASPSTGWEITVYYTAVEDFHIGADTDVTGCTKLDCKDGKDDLGTYPQDFVDAVKDEGTGRTS